MSEHQIIMEVNSKAGTPAIAAKTPHSQFVVTWHLGILARLS